MDGWVDGWVDGWPIMVVDEYMLYLTQSTSAKLLGWLTGGPFKMVSCPVS